MQIFLGWVIVVLLQVPALYVQKEAGIPFFTRFFVNVLMMLSGAFAFALASM